MSRKSEREKGVTLIEVVLYVALFAVIFMSVLQFMMAISEKNQVAKGRNKVETGMILVTQHIDEGFTSASSVDTVGTVFENDSGVLKLNGASGAMEYSLDGQTLMYYEGGVGFELTNDEISVTKFYLEEILDRTSEVTGVRLTVTLEYPNGDASETVVTSFLL